MLFAMFPPSQTFAQVQQQRSTRMVDVRYVQHVSSTALATTAFWQ